MRRRGAGANALILTGAALLSFPAAHLATAIRAQRERPAARAAGTGGNGLVRPSGSAWGRLELPRVGLDLVVFEGTSPEVLRKGPGHLSGTGCPDADGRRGNCVIAGHRDTFFRRLSGVRQGDLVRLSGAEGTVATYRLASRRIVHPDDVSALHATADHRLTLITCYPFSWTGPAPYRLVWDAVSVDAGPLASADPQSRRSPERPTSTR